MTFATADLHTHSCFSFDADPAATVRAMCNAAIEKGLTHLAVTDHFELNPDYPPLAVDDVWHAMDEAKKEFKGRLTLLRGVELGQPTQYPDKARALLESHPYDIVLGSLHNLSGMKDFYTFDLRLFTTSELHALFERVLDETAEICDFEGVHVITHLTYMQRYLAQAGIPFDFAPHRASIERLFLKIVEKGLALEVNTSTTVKSGFTLPSRELLQLYRECGGTRVTLGSDGHSTNAIAQHFDKGAAQLRECGFDAISLPTSGGLLTLPLIEKENPNV